MTADVLMCAQSGKGRYLSFESNIPYPPAPPSDMTAEAQSRLLARTEAAAARVEAVPSTAGNDDIRASFQRIERNQQEIIFRLRQLAGAEEGR